MIIRCKNCGDSNNPNSAHLYININENDGKFLQYYCQRCSYKGIIDRKFLVDYNSYNPELVKHIKIHEKKYKRNLEKYHKFKNKELELPIIKNKDNDKKLLYINKRLGINLDYTSLKKFNIVVSLYHFLEKNNLLSLHQNDNKDYIYEMIEKQFIGFLSMDNSYIIFRNILSKDKNDFRFFNFNIYNIVGNRKYYWIPNKNLNILNPEINIITCEGIFDLLGIYFHIKSQVLNNNTIFITPLGMYFNNMIKDLISKSFLKLNLDIYKDSDQSINQFYNIKNKYNSYINKFNIYENKLYKDFGVLKNKIEIVTKKIK